MVHIAMYKTRFTMYYVAKTIIVLLADLLVIYVRNLFYIYVWIGANEGKIKEALYSSQFSLLQIKVTKQVHQRNRLRFSYTIPCQFLSALFSFQFIRVLSLIFFLFLLIYLFHGLPFLFCVLLFFLSVSPFNFSTCPDHLIFLQFRDCHDIGVFHSSSLSPSLYSTVNRS